MKKIILGVIAITLLLATTGVVRAAGTCGCGQKECANKESKINGACPCGATGADKTTCACGMKGCGDSANIKANGGCGCGANCQKANGGCQGKGTAKRTNWLGKLKNTLSFARLNR